MLLLLHPSLVMDSDKFLSSHLHHFKRFYVGKANDRLLHPLHDDGLVGNRQKRLARQPFLQRAIEHIETSQAKVCNAYHCHDNLETAPCVRKH